MRKILKFSAIFTFPVVLLLCFSLTGCTYSAEEKQAMKEYEQQGEINAVNYIREKYGIQATVTDVACEKVDSGPVPDFTPAATGDVFVTMEYNEKIFGVSISGAQETLEGLDNYQYELIKSALEHTLSDVTHLSAVELFICYGEYHTMKDNKHGMIHPYFDGENLAEIMKEESAAVVVSYINQDVTGIDMDKVVEQTGIKDYLLVDYASKEYYDIINNPGYNISGTPLDSQIDDNMVYINGYRLTDSREDTYIDCEKNIIDDIILITKYPEETVSIEKTVMDAADKWNGHGFCNAKQVFDAYDLETDSSKVYIYVPVDKLRAEDLSQAAIVKQYTDEGGINHRNVLGGLTDDGRYIHGIIYTRDYTDIKFSVFIDEE